LHQSQQEPEALVILIRLNLVIRIGRLSFLAVADVARCKLTLLFLKMLNITANFYLHLKKDLLFYYF